MERRGCRNPNTSRGSGVQNCSGGAGLYPEVQTRQGQKMRSYLKGLLVIVCVLIVFGSILDRNDPPLIPLVLLGATSAVILAITQLLRRFAPRFGYWPAGGCLVAGLILFVWGASTSYHAPGNTLGSAMSAVGAIVIALIGVMLILGAVIAILVAWIVGDSGQCPEGRRGDPPLAENRQPSAGGEATAQTKVLLPRSSGRTMLTGDQNGEGTIRVTPYRAPEAGANSLREESAPRQDDALPAFDFDWVAFFVRFTCGAICGAILGFGFWVQMFRPSNSLRWNEHLPRLTMEWFGLEGRIDSFQFGFGLMAVFAVLAGLLVGLWPHLQRRVWLWW